MMMRRIGKCRPRTQKVMPHADFIDRIRKSLYFGFETHASEMEEMSRPLADLASEIFSEPHKGHSLNRLNTVAAGNVTATPCSLIMALIYLDRINMSDPGYVRRITPQELFIVSMMISTKFYAGHDEEIYFSDWAIDGNMTEDRLKQLELDFLCAIDWNLYISNEQFFEKLSSIEAILARREGLRRGWLTYTELRQMLPTFTLVKFLLNNISVMAISYAASVMTIAGAFFLASQVPGTILHRKILQTRVDQPTVMPLDNEEILPTSTTNLIHNDSIKSNVVISVFPKPNATCNVFNIELELRKLERDYHDKAQSEVLRRRNSGFVNENHLSLPNAVEQKLHPTTPVKLNWHKGQFSKTMTMGYVKLDIDTTKETLSHKYPLRNYLENWNNGTNSIFWQFFSSTAEQSFMRIPWDWYKLI